MLDAVTPIRTTPMPDEMRVLLHAYPRDAWEAHPGFAAKTQAWLNAHQMFRDLGEVIEADAQTYLDRDISPDEFAARLSRFGGALVRNLHGHHGWEDRSYFPELEAAEPRFARGLELLEADHAALDQVLDGFTRASNRVIQLVHLDEAQAFDETPQVLAHARTIRAFLDRHLGDEEDLAVPIILHHRMRG